MKKDERGVAFVIEFIVIVLVLGGIGFAGYKVMQSRKPKTTSSSSETKKTETTKAWKEGDFAVPGTYADADIVQIADGKWRLYYSIQPEVQGNQLEVYSSVSTDGKTWTREDGVRKKMATFPDVVKTSDGKYRMYFQNAALLKSAISTDGLTFTDETGTRIDKSNDAGLTLDNVAAPTVLLENGTYTMVYRGTINTRYASDTPNPTTQLLFWATSTDGLTFTKKGIAVDSRNSTLRGQLDGPDLVKWDDSKLHVFSTTYAGVYEFVFEGGKFSSGTLAYTLASSTEQAKPQPGNTVPADVAPPGDPTLAKISGVWYMYYGGSRAENGIHYATLQ